MENYTNNIIINSKTNAIYKALTICIDKWWSNDFHGSAIKINDEFEVRFGSSYKKIKVDEITINYLKWTILDAFINLETVQNKKEWVGTQIHWNFIQIDDLKSKLSITHVRLNKNLECFEVCDIGWKNYLSSIKKHIESKDGKPYDE